MKRITSSMLLFLVCAFCGCHTPHERGVEYKVVTLHGKQGPPEPELNRLASEGWRVVGFQRESEATDTVLLERKK
jgi:hypothetical protein